MSAQAYFARHAQTLVGSLGRIVHHPFATLMTMGVVAVALALPLFLNLLLSNVRNATGNWNEAFDLSIYMDKKAGAERTAALAKLLRQGGDCRDGGRTDRATRHRLGETAARHAGYIAEGGPAHRCAARRGGRAHRRQYHSIRHIEPAVRNRGHEIGGRKRRLRPPALPVQRHLVWAGRRIDGVDLGRPRGSDSGETGQRAGKVVWEPISPRGLELRDGGVSSRGRRRAGLAGLLACCDATYPRHRSDLSVYFSIVYARCELSVTLAVEDLECYHCRRADWEVLR